MRDFPPGVKFTIAEDVPARSDAVVEQFDVELELLIQADSVTGASFVGDQPFGDRAVDYSRFAAELGLDLARFEDDLSHHRFAEVVRADQDQGYSMGVTGTPTVLIAGKRLSGDRSIESYRTVIDVALEDARESGQVSRR